MNQITQLLRLLMALGPMSLSRLYSLLVQANQHGPVHLTWTTVHGRPYLNGFSVDWLIAVLRSMGVLR